MCRIDDFVFGTEHDGVHNMIAKMHSLAGVAVGRVVVQWCPGNEEVNVVQCTCRTAQDIEWRSLLSLVVIVPSKNSFGPGNVMYDKSNLCF